LPKDLAQRLDRSVAYVRGALENATDEPVTEDLSMRSGPASG
jgi:hypothetical protein